MQPSKSKASSHLNTIHLLSLAGRQHSNRVRSTVQLLKHTEAPSPSLQPIFMLVSDLQDCHWPPQEWVFGGNPVLTHSHTSYLHSHRFPKGTLTSKAFVSLGKNFLDISVIFLMHKNALHAKLGKQGEELLSLFLIQFIVHYTLLRDAQK